MEEEGCTELLHVTFHILIWAKHCTLALHHLYPASSIISFPQELYPCSASCLSSLAPTTTSSDNPPIKLLTSNLSQNQRQEHLNIYQEPTGNALRISRMVQKKECLQLIPLRTPFPTWFSIRGVYVSTSSILCSLYDHFLLNNCAHKWGHQFDPSALELIFYS